MNGAFYRVDKFVVPEAAREEFLINVLKTHEVLQAQEGFIRHTVLEQVSGPGEFNFVTIAEWESAEVLERVKAAVQAAHRARNFDPQAFFARLGIRADIANYKPVAA
ncbi:antibiotic biosynthesis monooxygenase [Rhizobium sullae]|uniref:Antibiotic biosynthesis monooxygenase n=1 Tax=Rhizobium sullae TaxID=50338 RepID=A0A2N0D5J1_RHISU|nr:antibiotic biosynthesis monooxygenase [Rhizobium sullae]PKA41360.1 antibiotic biosynthesis monooxygenase [Rhizobium sullae]UWU12713.1 antibiotic biosynthesis monooxygenase [Rhizobium sullae]